MGNFCTKCGKKLEEGEVCNCQFINADNIKNNQQQDPNWTQYQQTHSYVKPLLPSYNVNAFALLAIVLGIISLCISYGIVPAIIAIIFSVMAKKRVRSDDLLGIKFTKISLILGIIGCVVWLFNVILATLGIAALSTLY